MRNVREGTDANANQSNLQHFTVAANLCFCRHSVGFSSEGRSVSLRCCLQCCVQGCASRSNFEAFLMSDAAQDISPYQASNSCVNAAVMLADAFNDSLGAKKLADLEIPNKVLHCKTGVVLHTKACKATVQLQSHGQNVFNSFSRRTKCAEQQCQVDLCILSSTAVWIVEL